MPRRGQVKTKEIEADPIYKNRMVTKLINRAMRDGKKSVARKEVYEAFEILRKEEDPIKVFSQALENVKPSMEVRPRRIGGAAYQIPMPVRGTRRESLGIRWILAAANARSNSQFKTFAHKLAIELKDAANGEGGAVKKKTDMEKMAEANRAFAHFRW
jgi:small subunit ribosomal protein S7